MEVDFIVGNSLAIEVKATRRVRDSDLTPLRALMKETKFAQSVVVCQETIERISNDGIKIMPVENFLESLWKGQLYIE